MSIATIGTHDDEENPFLVTSSLEIHALLRSIATKGALLRMHIEGRTVAIITTILDVDPDNAAFIVDNSAEEDFNRRVVSADTVTFETSLDKVRIQFSVTKVESCMQEGRPALRASFPSSITRIQRREYYRVDIPVSNPATCTIPTPQNKDTKQVTLELRDISAGGISAMDNEHTLDNALNALFKNCRLELPEAGTVITDLQIVRSQDDTLANGKPSRSLGFAFINLSNPMNFIVQQYIVKLERKLNAKRRGFE
ncbi:flagellar brake protein [Pollutimonas subterranea]|uniref:Flagellar brake protein YcgR n=1 Tax=Pollutimonas subterranea TaxID=2045210 RepID=A0A2N4U5Q7_9BURK|nr:flagellar brake protein [Pollutimonas subterranea]PLC50358.1 flagellar brake protein [Pollutimonas subterranea]